MDKNNDLSKCVFCGRVDLLAEMKKCLDNEPPFPGGRPVLRAAIMGYELGAIQQYDVYKERLNMSEQRIGGFEDLAKQGMGDLLTQCFMFCLEMGWSFSDIQIQGLRHLQERQVEFDEDGWAESGNK